MTSSKRWVIQPGDKPAEALLSQEFDLDPIVAKLLVNRGITTPEDVRLYLDSPLDRLPDPIEMADMPAAVERIIQAKDNNEKVAVFGDYDVDGVTSTALLLRFFKAIGINAGGYIPDREAEGYGLNTIALDKLKSDGTNLVITVDTGISSNDPVDHANDIGLDVIITDHHQINGPLPSAIAVLNPAREDCPYPFKGLPGVGIAFKLCTAIRREMHNSGVAKNQLPNLLQYLDIVAIGIIADLSPLTGENRILVHHGLRQINSSSKAGVASLKKVSGLDNLVTSTDVAFELAPRLNSAGRLGHAGPSLELLITDDSKLAGKTAQFLNEENSRRKDIQNEIFNQALQLIESQVDLSKDKAIVLESDYWNAGVVGIVASKLADKFNLPVLLARFDGSVGKGSGRSVPGLDLNGCMKKCASELLKFGGHKAAVGFSVSRERYNTFKQMFLDAAGEEIVAKGITPTLSIDAQLDPRMVDLELVERIETLEPFGKGNRAPVFVGRSVTFHDQPFYMGADGQHIRLRVKGADNVQALGFFMSDIFRSADMRSASFDIVYTPEKNVWNGTTRIQLRLVDVQHTPANYE